MTSQAFRVISPVREVHAEAMYDLCAKTFHTYFAMHRDIRTWYVENSHYDWQASAIGILGSRLATHFGVWDYRMRIGRSVMRCGGIGLVSTHAEHRRQGLMAKTVPHSIQMMQQRGYHFSLLFGISDFYHRFGYARAWSDTLWVLHVDNLPLELPHVKFEQCPPRPTGEIARLHNAASANVTGSAVRPTYSAAFCTFRPGLEAYVWRDARNRLRGHVLVYPAGGRLGCIEATGQSDEILAVLSSLAKQKTFKEIQIETLPYHSPLAKKIRTLTCRSETSYVKSGAAMVRLINLRSTLQSLLPELQWRLQNSEMDDYRGALLLRCADQTAGLKLDRGRVTLSDTLRSKSVVHGGYSLAQLLIGADEPMELCEAAGIRLTGDAARLLRVLLPNQHPQLHQADRF